MSRLQIRTTDVRLETFTHLRLVCEGAQGMGVEVINTLLEVITKAHQSISALLELENC